MEPIITLLLSISGAAGFIILVLWLLKLPPFMPVGINLDAYQESAE